MRDQYAGDISDFLKLSLLRSIVPPGKRLGVAWYYVPGHDRRPDGRHLEYLNEDSWRVLDRPLYKMLKAIRTNRSVLALEGLQAWLTPTVFHRDAVEVSSRRTAWASGMVECLRAADFIFADPDNGLSREGVIHRKNATLDEVNALASPARPVVLIRFPSRNGTHLEQLTAHHSRLSIFRPITLRTCVAVRNKIGIPSPRIRWFTILNASKEIRESVQNFQRRLASIKGARAEVVEQS